MSLDERNQYDKDMTTEIDKIAQLDYAMEQGLERGRKEGREEGRIVEKRDVARNLIHLNAPVEMICQATGLSSEEVLAL